MVNENELMGGLQAAMQPAAMQPATSALPFNTVSLTDLTQAEADRQRQIAALQNLMAQGTPQTFSYDPAPGGLAGYGQESGDYQTWAQNQAAENTPWAEQLAALQAYQPAASINYQDYRSPVNRVLSVEPNQPIRITGAGGTVLYEGSDPAQIANIVGELNDANAQWNAQTLSGWKSGGVHPITGAPISQDWFEIGGNKPAPDTFGDVLKIGLPIALNFIPGLGQALSFGAQGLFGTALGTGLTTALGRTGAGIISGDPVLDSIKAGLTSGAISGLTAGALQGLGVTPGGAPSSGASSGIPGGIPGVPAFDPSVLYSADLGLGQLAGLGGAAAGAGGALSTAGDLVTVLGNRIPGAVAGGLPGAVGAGLGDIGADLIAKASLDQLSNAYNQTPPETVGPEVTITGQYMQPPSTGGLPGAVGSAGYEILPDGTIQFNQTPEQIDVTAQKTNPTIPVGSIAGVAPELLQPVDVMQPVEPDMITVEAKPIEKAGLPTDLLAPVAGEFAVQEILNQPGQSAEQAANDKKKGMTLSDKIGAGAALFRLLDSLLGGGGGGAGGGGPINTAAGTRASLSPVFSGALPTAGGAFSPQSLAQRDRSDIDYERYGYGPARSFFNYVPETAAERQAFAAAAAPTPRVGSGTLLPGALPGAQPQAGGGINPVLQAGFEQLRAAMPGADDAELVAFLGTPEGQQKLVEIFEGLGAQPRARGGSMGGEGASRDSFAVRGPGDGRSDDIPALLSDGEYVVDAETVALLGDGSSEAGAERLDMFRANVRKHKGRDLAEGKFSANAKPPERYLSGGRV